MIARQQVTYVQVDHRVDVVDRFDLFELREELGWVWLQKLAFWVLSWLGAYHEETVTTFTRTQKQNDKILASIFRQVEGVCELCDELHGNLRIFMGPGEHADLMELSEFRQMQVTVVSGRVAVGTTSGPRFYDIPMTIVPWMQGVLVVPSKAL